MASLLAVLLIGGAAQVASADYKPPKTSSCGKVRGTVNTLTFRVYVRGLPCERGRRIFRTTVTGKKIPKNWRCLQHQFPDDSYGTRCTKRHSGDRIYGVPTRQPPLD